MCLFNDPIIVTVSGSKYIGEWHQDLKHGKGKFVFQSGQVFEGEFHKDKMAGGRRSSDHKPGLLRPQTPLGSLIGWKHHRLTESLTQKLTYLPTHKHTLSLSHSLPPSLSLPSALPLSPSPNTQHTLFSKSSSTIIPIIESISCLPVHYPNHVLSTCVLLGHAVHPSPTDQCSAPLCHTSASYPFRDAHCHATPPHRHCQIYVKYYNKFMYSRL